MTFTGASGATGRFSVRRVVTSRAGGVSAPPYDSFNLGNHVGDDLSAVTANRDRLASQLGLAPGEPVLSAVTRAYAADDRQIERTRTTYRADRYRFRATLVRRR